MTAPGLPATFAGRQAEVGVVAEVLDRARRGAGGALVLWGEPGIGKTALLDHVTAASSDITPWVVRPARCESAVPFAGLYTLLRPVEHLIGALPVSSATALRGVLAGEPSGPGRLLTAVAVLSLLSSPALDRPVVVVVDDAHRLDAETAFVLGFVARRVRTDPVAILIADHDAPAGGPWEGLDTLAVGALPDQDAARLVAGAHPGIDEAAVTRAVDAGGGNPLALHELPTPVDDLTGAVPVGPRLRKSFAERLQTMRVPARELVVLLAAARTDGDQLALVRAAQSPGADQPVWDEANRSGLLAGTPDQPALRHPVVRAAVYAGASPSERRNAHGTLAAAFPPESRGHLWHRAATAPDVDEEIAGQLERTAPSGSGAVPILRRAAELSPDPAAATRRLAGAAVAAWHGGDATTARRLLADARSLTDEAQATRASRGLRGVLELAEGSLERAHRSLTRDIAELDDPRTGVELGAAALHAGWSAGRDDLVRETLAGLARLTTPGLPDVLPHVRRWWAPTTNPVEPVPSADLGDVMAQISGVESQLLPPSALGLVWGVDEPLADATHTLLGRHRRNADHTSLAAALARSARLDLAAGRWGAAEDAATEGLASAERIGAEHIAAECRGCLGWLAAARGDRPGVDRLAAHILQLAGPRRDRAVNASAQWSRGMVALAGGHADAALDLLARLDEPGHEAAHPIVALLACLDTVEAAVQARRPDIGERRVEALDAWTRRSGAPWARATTHLTRALLDEPVAERSYRAALDVPGASRRPYEHARAHLLYGEWLRRQRRRRDAAQQLDAAAQTFHALRAHPMLERARREQRLTTTPARRGSVAGTGLATLTAQELRVGQLAAEDLTNREIGARLRISDRTVGHHLSHVFAKLGVRSRRELAAAGLTGPRRRTDVTPLGGDG
ncbi:helix-turn-helix transcriptional regulator [Pseudonocardia sp. HH130629-09]|uniref:helix-turn-helix transcriptional regulator n=1 Tax=Pseudonocardia sp. HH130629-09 TaxID=1641402 RepID=UPI0006CB3B3A|nr:LuxR family transcriptional regulator [Pseudonocardia sp. HH130629-09]ALE84060.1 LuxR family transcriptional regulator [Pseudonocardia sp. HH130629-09]